jgi:endonuclease-3
MLTQNTNMANARTGYRQLRRAFNTWNKVMDADVGDVQRHIAVCGLARMRARRLQNLLRVIHARHGKLDLQFLGKLPPKESFDYLMGFFGVGPKTAACTLLFAFHMPLFPVDKGIHRLARRLALVRTKAGEAETGRTIQSMLTSRQCYPLHLLMFAHARQYCRPRNPKCRDCPLAELCPVGRRRLRHHPPQTLLLAPPRRSARFISAGIPKHGDADDS